MAELPRQLVGLMSPGAYPHPVREVQLVETHISWVLLTGEFAYKIKRPVAHPFLDLRAPERRAFYCAEELRLNRRFAPELYLDVCEVREEGGAVRIGGGGRIVEHCVKMRQFDRREELDRLLAAGQIQPDALDAFGRDLAQIHATLPVASAAEPWGSVEQVRRVVLDNIQQYEQAAARAGFAAERNLRAELTVCLGALADEIETRRAHDRVRECHGDLHARNIVRRGGKLVAFDCIEFEPAFRWIDIAEEVALLVADLRARGHPRHAHAFLSGYLSQSGDFALCRVLDLYRAHRALTRAKVAALEGAQADHDALLREARRALTHKSPLLVLTTGLSGSGKTWLAQRLAPDLGAIHLRSDVERKRLAGLAEHADSRSPTGGGLYTADNSAQVYAHLERCAEDVLTGGYSVIVDATFLLRAQRAQFAELARRASARLQVILCDAPLEVLRQRITDRHAARSDASEADLAVLDWQLRHREPIDPAEGLDVVKVSASAPESIGSALDALRT
ncbi:MAG TPA: AAA family ATPase [Steroidobacteraceae bacterium]|nr:AAA family ATPase [Steroidobacteraceae bacterium]